jgi:hypothetical protein
MVAVDKGIPQSQNVMFVRRITLVVELEWGSTPAARMMGSAYQFQNRDLHHALVKVRRLVLDDLDGHNLVGLHVLALDDLPKRSLTENVQDEVPAVGEGLETGWMDAGHALVAILAPQPVVDVEDIVVVLVVIAVVVRGLARLREDAPWVVC